MKILQITACVREYRAIYFDEEPDAEGNEQILSVDVPVFAIVEFKRGDPVAGPMILVKDGLLPAWTSEGYIGCAPADDDTSDQDWLDLYHDQQEEEGQKSGRSRRGAANKPKARVKAEPAEVPDDDADEEEEEDEDDDEHEGEVHLSGKKR